MVISETIPVTTAENKRSFSCLKRTYVSVRVMSHERLGELGTLSVNRERTSNIDLEDIVDGLAILSQKGE